LLTYCRQVCFFVGPLAGPLILSEIIRFSVRQIRPSIRSATLLCIKIQAAGLQSRTSRSNRHGEIGRETSRNSLH